MFDLVHFDPYQPAPDEVLYRLFGPATGRRAAVRAKILSRVSVDPVTGCWLWNGPTSGSRYKCDEAPKKGRGHSYPRMNLDGCTVAVHLALWTNEHGLIPWNKQIDHVCKNRLCVNPTPEHTELVTHKQNQKRRAKAAREAKEALECKTPTKTSRARPKKSSVKRTGRPGSKKGSRTARSAVQKRRSRVSASPVSPSPS